MRLKPSNEPRPVPAQYADPAALYRGTQLSPLRMQRKPATPHKSRRCHHSCDEPSTGLSRGWAVWRSLRGISSNRLDTIDLLQTTPEDMKTKGPLLDLRHNGFLRIVHAPMFEIEPDGVAGWSASPNPRLLDRWEHHHFVFACHVIPIASPVGADGIWVMIFVRYHRCHEVLPAGNREKKNGSVVCAFDMTAADTNSVEAQ